ncbi:HMG box family protein [Trichomonas vaginalis G3]|uniref:HMG box family protein n=1 Tax=Trichomonas vaginalis (strain ATCC PRA-98 / G3) TaxID=412133 RepID=A2E047_TRIV3|nr:HMG-box family [Trichomonas vaginalis G3]EAY13966.1 HMG box family protein [Trichomonas vaginalis G3]KAI5551784.1 HMG-box family [Trichomonas vaginalis G3]|eukprot:XP_001326189.1 HMG box family protein [Trichomonas vaginalis G3]
MAEEDAESPHAVKTPNAFILFSNEVRREISSKLPFSQISVEISNRWKQLDETSKQRYKNRAKELREKELSKNTEAKIKYKKKEDRIQDKIVKNFLDIDSFSSLFDLASKTPAKSKKNRPTVPKFLHLNPKKPPKRQHQPQ